MTVIGKSTLTSVGGNGRPSARRPEPPDRWGIGSFPIRLPARTPQSSLVRGAATLWERTRVVTGPPTRAARQQPTGDQPDRARRRVPSTGVQRILAAGRHEPAVHPHHRRERQSVDPDEPNQWEVQDRESGWLRSIGRRGDRDDPVGACRLVQVIAHSIPCPVVEPGRAPPADRSRLDRQEAASQSQADPSQFWYRPTDAGLCARTVTIRSNPAGMFGRITRNASRTRRLIAFRTTAGPARRPIERPRRACGSPFGRAYTVIGPRVVRTRSANTPWYSRSRDRRCRRRK